MIYFIKKDSELVKIEGQKEVPFVSLGKKKPSFLVKTPEDFLKELVLAKVRK